MEMSVDLTAGDNMGAMLSIDGVSRAFGSSNVLKQLAIDFHARALLLSSARRGRSFVPVGGRVADLARRALAMVCQSYELDPHMMVEENIALPPEVESLSAPQRPPVVGSSVPGRARQANGNRI